LPAIHLKTKQYSQHKKLKKLNTNRTNNLNNKWTNELSRQFSKEEIQMDNKYMKKCLKYLATKEIPIKTTLRFHLKG
jgi:hypothetical protein